MSRIVQDLIYRLRADTAGLVAGLKAAGDKADDVSKKFTDSGKKMTKGLTLPILGVGAAMVKLAGDAGNAADRLLDLEQITGLSTDTLQELDVVAAEAGVSADGLAKAVERFNRRLPAIEAEGGAGADAIKRLGVNIRDSNGQLRSADDLLPEFIRGLEGIDSAAERGAVSQQLFGRSIEDLGPVVGLGADEFERLRQQARDTGVVIGRDALEAADAYRAEVEQMQVRIKAARQEIGQELIPVISELIPIFEDAVGVVINAVKYFTDLETETQKTILAIGGIVAGLGPMLVILGKTILVAKAATAAFAAFWVALTGPIGLAVAGIAAAGAAVIGLARSIRNVANEDRERRVENEEILNQQRAQTVELQEHQQLAERQRTVSNERRQQEEAAARAREAAAKAAQDELDADLRRMNEIAAPSRQQAEERYQGLLDELDAQNEIERIELKRAEAIAELGRNYVRSGEAVDLLNEYYDRLIEQEQELGDIRASQDEEARLNRVAALNEQHIQRLQEQNLSQLELLELQKHKEIQLAEETGADIWLIEQYYANEIEQLREKMAEDEKQRIQDGIDDQIRAAEEGLQIAAQLMGELTTLSNQLYQNRKATLDIEYDERVQRAQDTIQDEEELAGEIEKINQERAVEMAKIARKEAVINKFLSAAQAGVATSLAFTKALPNIPLAVTIGALGAAQVAAILAEPLPQIPQFATGGAFTVPPGFPMDSFPLPGAMVQSGETVEVRTREQEALESMTGSRPMNIVVQLDGREVARSTADYINNGQVRVQVGR